ncbi:MAG: class I SAM-dependent methyltransferase [Alphaproteobacteria bacterium]|nr:class I SAM-dependent methyltransferase [Alphaproteobacteria bacterium]
MLSAAQARTGASFAFKWAQRATYESEAALARTRAWLRERYGDPAAAAWWRELPPRPVLLDAGCGAALSAIELFGDVLDRVHYVGVDVSEAVEVAAARFGEAGWSGAFFQADLSALPLPAGSCDVIFAEGVLHHTDSTAAALKALAPLLSPRGRFLFYVYRRKGPIREFTDDYIRARLQGMSAEAAWQALLPLTKLGKALGDLDLTVEVPEAIGLLEIPAGRVPLQRLFYWHVFKAFHHPDLSLEELNHINFDWYAPANAHRQSPEEVRAWCAEASLEIEREVIEPAGITVIARRAA